MAQGLAFLLLLLALFCVFGFLASFEPGPYLAFRIGYPAVGIASLAIAIWLLRKKPRID